MQYTRLIFIVNEKIFCYFYDVSYEDAQRANMKKRLSTYSKESLKLSPKSINKVWMELKIKGPVEGKDRAAEILIIAGSPGVIDKDTYLKGYLPLDDSTDIEHIKMELECFGWGCTVRPFEDRDWTTRWRRYSKPVRISKTLMIKPTWEEVKPQKGQIIIEIDPGRAFGTGSHPSTRVCLKAMEVLFKEYRPKNMLDVGTGSGILAIAARKLGAEYIVGIDTDSVTIRVAKENARLNLTKIALSKRGIEDIPGRFSMVVANIITEELVKIAPALVKRISPDGFLILSGILRERVAEVKKAYRTFFQKTYRTFRYGEWVCLVYRASYEKIFS